MIGMCENCSHQRKPKRKNRNKKRVEDYEEISSPYSTATSSEADFEERPKAENELYYFADVDEDGFMEEMELFDEITF